MRPEIPAIAMILLVLAASGCVSRPGLCEEPCDSTCSGDTRLYDGACLSGECMYAFEQCEHGCLDGECNERPPHLVFADSTQRKGAFYLEITKADIELAEEEDAEDTYDIRLLVSNRGEDGIFSIKSVSIVAETGIMHDSVGFSWSDLVPKEGKGSISLVISGVPPSLREQNTTVIVRTNQGHYYYQASFEE